MKIKKDTFSLFLILLITFISIIVILSLSFFMNNEKDVKIYAQFFLFISFLSTILFLKKDIVKPHFAIPLIMLFYGLIGGNNFIKRGADVDYKNELFFLIYFFFNFLIYFLLSLKKVKSEPKIKTLNITNQLKLLIFYFISIIGLLAFIIDWYQIGGIPLFSAKARFGSLVLFRNIYLVGIFATIYIFVLSKKNFVKVLLLLYFTFSILSAYRTVILLLFLSLFYYYLTYYKVSFRLLFYAIFIVLISFLGLNYLKYQRDLNMYGIDNFKRVLKREKMPKNLYFIASSIHTVREGPQIFQQIRDNLDGKYGYGSYFFEQLSTVLPGKQRGYGNIYNNLTHAKSIRTKTATILAPGYIDFGVLGIILLAVFLSYLTFNFYTISSSNNFFKVVYVFFNSYLSIWLHSGGIFNPTFLLILISISFLSFLCLDD